MEGPTAPCWESSVSSDLQPVFSSCFVDMRTWNSSGFVSSLFKACMFESPFQLKFSVWPDYQSSVNVEESHFQTDRLEKVTDSTCFLLSFWAQRGTERGHCDIWRSLSDIVGKSQVGTWKFFPHQSDKLVNNWKNQRTLNSVISYKLNLFDKHSQDKSKHLEQACACSLIRRHDISTW